MNRDREYRPAPMSLAQRAALRSQDPRALRQPARRRVYPLLALVAVVALLVIAAGGFEYWYRDRIYPNVYVSAAAVSVSGQTQDAAAAALHQFGLAQRFRPVVLRAPGDAPLSVPAHQLGYRIDVGRTAYRAYTVGHNGSVVHRVEAQLQTLVNGADVTVAQSVDRRALHAYLVGLAARLNRPARPGIPGRRLNVTRAQRLIASRLLGRGGVTLRLPFIAIPALPAPHPRPRPRRHPRVVHHHK